VEVEETTRRKGWGGLTLRMKLKSANEIKKEKKSSVPRIRPLQKRERRTCRRRRAEKGTAGEKRMQRKEVRIFKGQQCRRAGQTRYRWNTHSESISKNVIRRPCESSRSQSARYRGRKKERKPEEEKLVVSYKRLGRHRGGTEI